MAQTLKNMVDSVRAILTKAYLTDDSRLDPDYIAYKLNQARAQLITDEYAKTGTINPTWLSDLGTVTLYKVNYADDNSVTCNCDVSKTVLPQVLNMPTPDGSIDLGVYSIISPCGTKIYYHKRMSMWRHTPSEHTNSLFKYYDRINSAVYVNSPVTKLRVIALLLNPQDGFTKNSAPVLSGSLVNGTTYKVMFGTIIYNNVVYLEGTTFTASATANYTGNGIAYLNSQAAAFADTDPYPASGDMIRQIELEVLTKEYGIEMKEGVAEQRNDSRDDANKAA